MEYISLIVAVAAGAFLFSLIADDFGKDELNERLDKLHVSKKKKEQVTTKGAIAQVFDTFLNPFVAKKINSNTDTIKSSKYLLTQAGLNADDETLFKHMFNKFYFMIAGLVVSIPLLIALKESPIALALPIIFPMFAFRYPDIKLRKLAKYRMTEVRYGLADSLDLLTICVEAGLGLDAALGRVAAEVQRTCPVLALEFSRVGKDILAGVPRQEAFRNLAGRNSVDDLQSFVALLIQTDKLGTSIAQSLRTFSDTLRTRRKQRVETLASQASVKMVIPLVLFIMPAMFMVLMGPAAINLISIFSNSSVGK